MKKILFLYIIHLGFALQPIQIQACCLDNEAVLANGTAIILQSPKVDNTKTIQFIKDFYANYVLEQRIMFRRKKALYSQIAKAAER